MIDIRLFTLNPLVHRSQHRNATRRVITVLPAVACAATFIALSLATSSARAEKLHFTYLWHLEQPIYWPDQQVGGADRYERAAESIFRTDGGAAHPENNLRDIFGWADRVAVYQYRARDSIDAIRWAPQAGAQISYSGGLIENVQSLGNAGLLGYGSNWYTSLRQARNWSTSGAKPRADVVVFPFHHPLLPLIADSTVRKEIELYKAVYADAWGVSPAMSRGMFPPEMAYSSRLIPILQEQGVDWIFVSGEHISRACVDFPIVLGSGGINCDPPNRADQLNPAQSDYYRISISRGCGPAEAYPYAYTPHRAQYVDPDTGQVSSVIVVPCAQGIGWEDGYAPMGLGHFNSLETLNNPARPMLVVLAHDGDNAWGGGFSYYQEATPNLVSSAQSAGYTATTVEQYLQDHPVPAGDIVHVEDGAWVNADGDFGSPVFLNWNWPLVANGQIDIPNGWAEDERNWAVITAAQNRVDTAEQILGPPNMTKVLYPDGSSTAVERAWHYFLGALNSGYMYYGTAVDMEVKPTIACNEAMQHADAVIGDGSLDATPPTIWIPQRHPWNPGSLNFGPQYGYQSHNATTDFWVWTFVYDVSGVSSVTLKYRVDLDGDNPTGDVQNETYAGGASVGSWQSIAMNQRVFPAGNVNNDPNISFFEMPQYIADEYYAQVTGLSDVLVNYYIEAVDANNTSLVARSPIQHVYVGDGSGSNPGGGGAVAIDPDPAVAGQSVTIDYDPAGRVLDGAAQVHLHYGFNGWSISGGPDVAMTWNAGDEVWRVTVTAASSASQLDVVFNNGSGTWDNNSGQDWHFDVDGGSPEQSWTLDGNLDTNAFLLASNGGLDLHAGILGDTLYIATQSASGGNDRFILLAETPGAMTASPWGKSGTIAGPSAFVGNENDNNWSGWFTAIGSADTASTPGGILETTIDLNAQFGGVPQTIHLAVASYPTSDGSTLVASLQAPATINSDANVDAAEYLAVSTCQIRADAQPIAADIDGDCIVDANDLAALVQCVAGPNTGLSAQCTTGQNADIDDDGDADLADYAAMQIAAGD